MKKRQLGNSDLYVTEMGLGCMSLGTSETEALRIIDEAINLGINFFDTADLYDYGLNEEFVGKSLKRKTRPNCPYNEGWKSMDRRKKWLVLGSLLKIT